MAETRLREEICAVARSLFERGFTPGSSGNISVRLDDGGWLVTPTNESLGFLDPARLSRLDAGWEPCLGPQTDQGNPLARRALRDPRDGQGDCPSALDALSRCVDAARHRPARGVVCHDALPAHALRRDGTHPLSPAGRSCGCWRDTRTGGEILIRAARQSRPGRGGGDA